MQNKHFRYENMCVFVQQKTSFIQLFHEVQTHNFNC